MPCVLHIVEVKQAIRRRRVCCKSGAHLKEPFTSRRLTAMSWFWGYFLHQSAWVIKLLFVLIRKKKSPATKSSLNKPLPETSVVRIMRVRAESGKRKRREMWLTNTVQPVCPTHYIPEPCSLVWMPARPTRGPGNTFSRQLLRKVLWLYPVLHFITNTS